MGRPPCCDKSNVKKGPWTAEEDTKILAHVSKHGTGNWTSVPKKAGLKRCGKSCRLRWTNYLRPDLKHDNFTPQEEELIIRLHATIGSRWSLIAAQLPGRTDNDVKNYWNTKLRKKLFQMGIDPVTHKPFSQILADYGAISGLQKAGNRFGSLNRDLKNAFMSKSESSPIPQDCISNIRNHSMMPIRNTMVGPIQDSPLNYNINNNYSLDLLSQLQAIQLVTQASNCTNQETIQPYFFNEGSSSSSSSSNVIQVEPQPFFPGQPFPNTTPSSPFLWSEFLQEDVFLSHDQQQQQHEEDLYGLSSTGSSNHINDEIPQSEFENGDKKNLDVITNGYTGDAFGVSSSSNISFVDAILDQDSEMLWEFPSLLDEPFY